VLVQRLLGMPGGDLTWLNLFDSTADQNFVDTTGTGWAPLGSSGGIGDAVSANAYNGVLNVFGEDGTGRIFINQFD
jgi:hypothetical protein